jgi:hypothetical protein
MGAEPGGVEDTQGLLLDGKNTGTPGSNYLTVVNRKNLVWPKSIPKVGHRVSTSTAQRPIAQPRHSASQGKVLVMKSGLNNRVFHVKISGDDSPRKLSTGKPAHVNR